MSILREDLDAGRVDLSDVIEAGEPLPPPYPGETLRDFLNDYGLTANKLATEIGVAANRIGEILVGKRAITADTALRLARAFGTTAEFWLNLQAHHDLEVARRESGSEIERRVRELVAA